jgi:sucrose phosphorylase
MRAINRHNYSRQEIEGASRQEVVQRLLKLIEFRNSHPAFNGKLEVIDSDRMHLKLKWKAEKESATLKVDFQMMKAEIHSTDTNGVMHLYEP